MAALVRIDTLANLNDGSEIAEERGIAQLARNNYGKDMEEMYSIAATGDVMDPTYENLDTNDVLLSQVTAVKTVRMSYWGRGRLYDSDDVQAFEIDGKLWTLANEDAEWYI